MEYDSISFQDWSEMWLDYIGPKSHSIPSAVHQYTYERIRDRRDGLRGFVAAGPKPIGFVHYYFHPSTYSLTDACTIEDLYVSSAARGRGVGRWLIERVAQVAAQAGAKALNWKTSHSNVAAISLYKKLAIQDEVYAFRKPL